MEPGESFDQTGFELPAAPQVAPKDSEQSELFGDDYAQPDAGRRLRSSRRAGLRQPTASRLTGRAAELCLPGL